MTSPNPEKIKLLALDLTKDYPRSPRAKLAGYILAARALDKCRAELNKTIGEYHFDCPLDNMFFGFAEIKGADFKNFVATGATDEEVAEWITKNAKKRTAVEIIKWNNQLRDKRLSDLDDRVQEIMEENVEKYVPKNRVVYHWFDVFDYEEERI